MKRSFGAAVLIFLLPGTLLFSQEKSKKTYELIYSDVQFLKEQVQLMAGRLDRTATDIAAIQEQLKNLADLLRTQAARQESLEEGVRAVPSQYRDLAQKMDQLSNQLLEIAAGLASREPAVGKESAAAPQAPQDQKAVPASDKKPEGGKPAEGTAPPAAAQPAKPAISPQEAYSLAYNDYLKGNFDLAVASFKLYRQQFPESPLADDAMYWMGESYYSQKKSVEAIDIFDQLVLTYPRSEKVAAALLKKGLCLADLGKKEEAVTVFKLLGAKYPLEAEARIAAEKIKELTAK